VELGGREIALRAAQDYRTLRKRGVTACKTIDTVIATRRIEDQHMLLRGDRGFDPFVKHLGLRTV
jgi:hypothetical protein